VIVFVCRCHDEKSQGAFIGDSKYSEWILAEDVCNMLAETINLSGHRAYRLSGTLQQRIDSIKVSDHLTKERVLAIEPHFNWNQNSISSGYFSLAYYKSINAQLAAECIGEHLQEIMPKSKNKGINLVSEKKRWIGTRKEYEAKDKRLAFILDLKCPSIIIECLHLSNSKEAAWVRRPENRMVLGRAIGDGVVEYANLMEEKRENNS